MTDAFIEKTLVVNKKPFKYVEKGKGKLVFLVHGWPETWRSWKNQINFISNLGFKVVCFNTRGYPGSYTPDEISDYSMKFFMDDLMDILDFFNKKDVILIGHDWGAPICWNTAAYHEKNVSAVIGISVPYTRRGKISSLKLWEKLYKNIFFYQNYFQKPNIPELELALNVNNSLKKIYYWCSAEGYRDSVKTSPKKNTGLLEGIPYPYNKLSWLDNNDLEIVIKEFEEHGFGGSLNRYRAQDLDWQQLKELDYMNIKQPSIFIGGEYDPVRFFIKDYDSYKNAGKFCDNFKGKYIVKDAGHWVQQEKPNQVNTIIKKFLSDLFNL